MTAEPTGNATLPAAGERQQVTCRHCGKAITNEGYALPTWWWHLSNGSFNCDTTTAAPNE